MRIKQYALLSICCILPAVVGIGPPASPTTVPTTRDDSFSLDGFDPAPKVAFGADTLDGLTAAAKPTLFWDCDQSNPGRGRSRQMLWITTDADGNQHFDFGIPQQVHNGSGHAFWALLQTTGEERDVEHDFDRNFDLASRRRRSLQLVESDPTGGDHGAGDYIKIIASDPDGSVLYQLGIQTESGGNGHGIDERRIFVLHDGHRNWQYVGEGPEESSETSGCECYNSTAEFSAKFTHDAAMPVVIKVTSINSVSVCSESADPSVDPDLEVRRDGILDGALPAQFRWPNPQYVIAGKDDTLELVARRVVHYIPLRDEERPAAQQLARWRIRKMNPGIDPTALKPGARIEVPADEEIGDFME